MPDKSPEHRKAQADKRGVTPERYQEIEDLKAIARRSFSEDLAIMLAEMRLTGSFREPRYDDEDRRQVGDLRCLFFIDPFCIDPEPIMLIAPKTVTLSNPPYKDLRGYKYTSESSGPGMYHDRIYAYWKEIGREYPRTERARLINELVAAIDGRETVSLQHGYITVRVNQDGTPSMELVFDPDQIWKHGEEYYRNFMRSLQQDYGLQQNYGDDETQRRAIRMAKEKLIRQDMLAPLIRERAKIIRKKVSSDMGDWYQRCARLKYILNEIEEGSPIDNRLKLLESMIEL